MLSISLVADRGDTQRGVEQMIKNLIFNNLVVQYLEICFANFLYRYIEYLY